MTNDKSNQLLGELLSEAGLLQIDDLREAANIARSQKLPIGKVLVMSGYISKELLEAAVEAQSRFKDGFLKHDIGVRALFIISKKNNTLDQALAELGQSVRPPDSTSHRLGALLLDANLLTKPDFDKALEESKRCGLPLGRVLTNLSIVSEQLINFALNAQKMLRSGKISKADAVKSLVGTRGVKISTGNLETVPLDQSQISSQIEQASVHFNQQLGMIDAHNNDQQTPQQQIEALSLHHMLRIAGLIQTEALESAIKDSLENPEIMGIILKRSGLLEEFVIEAAKECCQLIASGELKPEHAIIALHHCQRTRNSVKDCLEEFGWMQGNKIP